MTSRVFGYLLVALAAAGCARAPLKNPADAMRPVGAPAALSDDLPLEGLLTAIEAQEKLLMAGPGELSFGARKVSRSEYAAALRELVLKARSTPDRGELMAWIRERFEFLAVYGRDHEGEVFMTSYYEPVIQGSLKPDARFTQPLYGQPQDLAIIDVKDFDPASTIERKLRGRLTDTPQGKRFVPYYTREEIDGKGALRGRGLELAWADPVDAYFLQVQGSATLQTAQGRKLRVNYAERNGGGYESIGKFLKDRIPKEQLNLHTIESALRAMPAAERDALLFRNPSYVFFKLTDASATTSLGAEAVDGRTIASDARFFPKGALAFLEFEKPVFLNAQSLAPEPKGEPTARFVLDQDTGGAITGGGRIDLFWGRGDEAKRYAGVMQHTGRLWYLVPR